MIDWPQVSATLNGVELLAIIWLLIHLRHSSAPYQSALIEEQRRGLDILRHNLSRLNAEHLEYQHEAVKSSEQIWEELRRIHARLDIMHCPIGEPRCPLNHMPDRVKE